MANNENGPMTPDICPECEARIARAWQGSGADYVSPPASGLGYGDAPYSELAVHTQIAGKPIERFALFTDQRWAPHVSWAQVQTAGHRITDGLPGEVLPDPVRRALGGFGHEDIPSENGPLMAAIAQEVSEENERHRVMEESRHRQHEEYLAWRRSEGLPQEEA